MSTQPIPTDQMQVQAALQSPRHFGAIIERYQQPLLRYILRSSDVSVEDAQDILQETFIKAYQNLHSYDPTWKLSSWLYRITRNQLISDWRKRNARPHGHVVDVEQHVIDALASQVDTLATIDAQLLRDHLDTLLQQLDQKYREVIILYFFEDKSYKDIADILHKPEGTIATLLNRAKKQLLELYQQQTYAQS